MFETCVFAADNINLVTHKGVQDKWKSFNNFNNLVSIRFACGTTELMSNLSRL